MHRLRGHSALSRLRAYLPPRAPVPHPVHRLDLNTSGVLVFAKSPDAASHLMRAFEERRTHKRYATLCVAAGALARAEQSELTVDAPICKLNGAEVEHCERRCGQRGEAGAQEARTRLQLLAQADGTDGENCACAELSQNVPKPEW